MATCPKCSAKVLPDDLKCRSCGAALPRDDDADDAPDAMIGNTVADNFEIVELLGEGAMGRVYAARQISLDKMVAIKVLHRHLANDPKVAKRFHREARAASRLSHPNSLQIIDFGDDNGTLYIAMELLDGDDLLAIIEDDSPLSPRRIGNILGQVLTALDEAHHAGIIHRDLKPENVLVVEGRGGTEHVKVCDFGIAKIQESEGGSAITVTGFVCGTPEYMAPEQARGEDIDGRADIYAVGCMLYQMLCGVVPFKADSALGIITKHLTELPIPPRERRPDLHIPEELQAICLRAMSKDPSERYQDASSMRTALSEAVSALGPLADEKLGRAFAEPTQRTRQRGREAKVEEGDATRGAKWPWVLAAIVGAVVFGVLALPGLRGDDGALNGDLARSGPRSVRVTSPTPDAGGAVTDSGAGRRADAATAPIARDAGTSLASANGESAVPDPGTRRNGRSGRRQREGTGRTTTTENTGGGTTQSTTGTTEATSATPGETAYEEGRRLFLANDVGGAITRFEEAARLMPNNPQVQKQLGRAYMRSGRVRDGLSAYRRYLELAPNAPDRAIIEQMIAQQGG